MQECPLPPPDRIQDSFSELPVPSSSDAISPEIHASTTEFNTDKKGYRIDYSELVSKIMFRTFVSPKLHLREKNFYIFDQIKF